MSIKQPKEKNQTSEDQVIINIRKINSTLPPNVTLAAAIKYQSQLKINAAIKAGITALCENYVSQAEKTIESLGPVNRKKVKLHLIGHLQSNKVRKAVELFDVIQTVDSEKIALKLNNAAKTANKTIRVLVQVNIGQENSKSGISPEGVLGLTGFISNLSNLKLIGLMAIEPLENSTFYFKQMKKLFDKLNSLGQDLTILSMGTSTNYNDAIRCGATMVRLGTALFGQRQ